MKAQKKKENDNQKKMEAKAMKEKDALIRKTIEENARKERELVKEQMRIANQDKANADKKQKKKEKKNADTVVEKAKPTMQSVGADDGFEMTTGRVTINKQTRKQQ